MRYRCRCRCCRSICESHAKVMSQCTTLLNLSCFFLFFSFSRSLFLSFFRFSFCLDFWCLNFIQFGFYIANLISTVHAHLIIIIIRVVMNGIHHLFIYFISYMATDCLAILWCSIVSRSHVTQQMKSETNKNENSTNLAVGKIT